MILMSYYANRISVLMGQLWWYAYQDGYEIVSQAQHGSLLDVWPRGSLLRIKLNDKCGHFLKI